MTRWAALCERVRLEGVRDFANVTDEFLALMWCLDQYRIADAPPQGMGNQAVSYGSRMDGIYRGKGNWFSMLLSLLLDNRTGQTIRPRSRIKGFSQWHQIDLAWPDRDVAPVVCAESKVTGGPAYRRYPARGATNDFSNRRKELKFAATDLKLSRREQTQKIGHWDAPEPPPEGSNVETIDLALWRIESEIQEAIESGAVAEPVQLAAPVDPDELEPDRDV